MFHDEQLNRDQIIRLIQHYANSLKEVVIKDGCNIILKAILDCPNIRKIQIGVRNPSLDFGEFVNCPGWRTLKHFTMENYGTMSNGGNTQITSLPLQQLPAESLTSLTLEGVTLPRPECLKDISLAWTRLQTFVFWPHPRDEEETLLISKEIVADALANFATIGVKKLLIGDVEFQKKEDIEDLQRALLRSKWKESADFFLKLHLKDSFYDGFCWQIKPGLIKEHRGICRVLQDRWQKSPSLPTSSKRKCTKWNRVWELDEESGEPIEKKKKAAMMEAEASFVTSKEQILQEIVGLKQEMDNCQRQVTGVETFDPVLELVKSLKVAISDSLGRLTQLDQSMSSNRNRARGVNLQEFEQGYGNCELTSDP